MPAKLTHIIPANCCFSKQKNSSTCGSLPEEFLTIKGEIDLFFGANSTQQEKDKFWKGLTRLLIGKRKTPSELLPEETGIFLIRFKKWNVLSYEQNEQVDHQKGGTGYA